MSSTLNDVSADARHLHYPWRRLLRLALAAICLGQTPAALASAAPGIEWVSGASDAAVGQAFASAQREGKPVMLYWGATWCPPCNRLKATLFNRSDFIALSRAVVPVYLDGDLPGAQKQGSHFRVVGYPTLLMFSPQGIELTRLAGEADPQRVMAAMRHALAGGRPLQAVFADALAGTALPLGEWRALAYYSWDTDEAQLIAAGERSVRLRQLAERARGTDEESALRLWLKSFIDEQESVDAQTSPFDAKSAQARIDSLLKDTVSLRLQGDAFTAAVRPLVLSVSAQGSTERADLVRRIDAALASLQDDKTLSRADRVEIIAARVELARVDLPDSQYRVSLESSLLNPVRQFARQADRDIRDRHERQAVITRVGDVLARAGLWGESDALLMRNLKKSHAPYYLMSDLANNARRGGRPGQALAWYERAWRSSEGPATRLQWGAAYIGALVDLAPADSRRLERAVDGLIADAARDRSAFYERSERSLKRTVAHLRRWNAHADHSADLARWQKRFAALCNDLPVTDPQRDVCQALWS